MKNLINNILEAGIFSDLAEAEKKRIRLLNRLIFLSTIVIIVFGIIDAVNGFYQMILIALFVCMIGFSEQILVRKRHYATAKYLIYFLILTTVSFTSVFVGNESGAQYMLVPIAMVPLLIFNSRTTSLVLFVTIFLSFASVYYLQQLIAPVLVLPDRLIPMYTLVTAFSMMGIIYMFTSYARSINESYEEIILKKNDEISEAYKDIKDSINYAKRIQSTIFPSLKDVKELLPDSFILYKPKDIVAGDFYWVEKDMDKIFFAVADCTGHGVPGAMMSVMCSNALNKAVKESGIYEPAKILDKTVEILEEQFGKSEHDVKDGMDIAFCCVDKKSNKLNYSGANNPLCMIRNGELTEIKADKQPIGKHTHRKPFTNHEIDVLPGDCIYIFTDGFADQFGGEKGKKFKYSKLKEVLLSISAEPMSEQKEILNETFERWKGDLEQIDDVCLMGVRL